MSEDLADLLTADPAQFSYEQARDGLARIVAALEAGTQSLEQSLALWERGEMLAQRCTEWLDRAQARLDQVSAGPAAAEPEPDRDAPPW